MCAVTAFRPSRLGHVNMFVSDLEKSIAFYNDIAGIELVRREPTIAMAFHSNGSSHHDLGLVEVQPGERLGVEGFVQVSSNRATKAGLNHLGWEMKSEAELIKALSRAKEAGQPILNTANHQISHAAYLADPDGNYHEFYADAMKNWRSIFNLEHEDLVTEEWNWEAAGQGMGPIPMDPNDRRRVGSAIFHPTRISHAVVAVETFAPVVDFLTTIGGLNLIEDKEGVAMFCGDQSDVDLMLVSTEHGFKRGLRAIALQVENENDLRASCDTLAKRNIKEKTRFDLDHKRGVVVTDPDDMSVEFFYRPTDGAPRMPQPMEDVGKGLWIHLA